MDEVFAKITKLLARAPTPSPTPAGWSWTSLAKPTCFLRTAPPVHISGWRNMMCPIWSGFLSMHRSSPSEQGVGWTVLAEWHQWRHRNVKQFSVARVLQVQFSLSPELAQRRHASITQNNIRERAWQTVECYTKWDIAVTTHPSHLLWDPSESRCVKMYCKLGKCLPKC